MKRNAILLIMLIQVVSLLSCRNKTTTSTSADTAAITTLIVPANDSVSNLISGCYTMISGLSKKDTSFIRLMIDGSAAKGEMITSIYQKDKRQGSFTGTIKDSILNGTWTFVQEGINDSLPLVFRVNGTTLEQKKFSYDRETGRAFIADTASFGSIFNKVNCD